MDNSKSQFNSHHHIKQEELIINDQEICEEYQFDPLPFPKNEIEDPDTIEEFEIVNSYYDESRDSPLLEINDSISKYMDNISKYMIEIARILNANELINVPNALALNKYMQEYLSEIRQKIEVLIEKCRDLYKRNSALLIHQCKPNSYKSRAPYCGAPFFKSGSFHPCWPHPDYVTRKDSLKEFFPINVQHMRSCNWTLRDKVDLLQGFKLQMLKYKGRSKAAFGSSDEQKIKVYREQVKTLYDEVKDDDRFSFNFKDLSSEILKGRHDSYSCAGMWNMYMRPDINRTDFTESENKVIHMAVKEACNGLQWYEIAKLLENRTALQCIIQYWTVVMLKRYDDPTANFKWTEEQDNLLIELVKKHTIGNNIQWIKINSHFPHLEKNRLIARYLYSCKPGLQKGPFTMEEDIKLLAAVDEFGEDFPRISKQLFPDRSVVQLRSHYQYKLKDTIQKDNWSLEMDKKLVTYVEVNNFDWLQISHLFNNRFTRTGCRTRYTTIAKHLAKCPSNSLENVPRRKRKHKQTINLSNWMDKLHELPNLAQERPKASTKRKLKIFYKDRLRATERSFYERFKYSYDYVHGNDFDCFLIEISTLLHISKALEYEEMFASTEECPPQLPRIVFENLLLLRHCDNWIYDGKINLPPSWGTILGLRGLFIFKSDVNEELQSTSKKVRSNGEIASIDEEDELDCHKFLFKKRFRTAFFKACLLSFLHSTEFRPHCSIQVVS